MSGPDVDIQDSESDHIKTASDLMKPNLYLDRIEKYYINIQFKIRSISSLDC